MPRLQVLGRRAAVAGISIPELLRKKATRLASRPSTRDWLERTRRRPSGVTAADIETALDETRASGPTMLVVDASCLYEVVADGTQAEAVRRRLAEDPDQGAPQLIDAEVLGLIRRDLLAARLDGTAASQAVADLRDWPGERFDHRLLLDGAWESRAGVRTWDALYVALAEAMEATLLTRDERLARAPGPSCRIEVIGS